jgi:hypothetical protein
MPVWVWIAIAAAVVVVAALLWVVASWQRRRALQGRFGPEYERTVGDRENRREAEAELAERVKRREQLDIRPLSPAARKGYLDRWTTVQAEFVDDPSGAVAGADGLVREVMAERGYPVADFEQRVADVSVDHPHVVEHYRTAHGIADRAATGGADTEELRQAMHHYRALFDDLLEAAADEPLARGEHDTIEEGATHGQQAGL